MDFFRRSHYIELIKYIVDIVIKHILHVESGRMVSQDYEPSEEVIKILTQYIGGSTSEIHVPKLLLYPHIEPCCPYQVLLLPLFYILAEVFSYVVLM